MDIKDRIGAWITPAGCSFRVWAPHAKSVAVLIKDGLDWEIAAPLLRQTLTRDGDYWSATVPGVTAGKLYRFEIKKSDDGIIERLDPAARDVLSSELTRSDPSSHNASIVVDAEPFPWAPFTSPSCTTVPT